jgi:hypothetical protein
MLNQLKKEPLPNEIYRHKLDLYDSNKIIFNLAFFLHTKTDDEFFNNSIEIVKGNLDREFFILDVTEPIFPYIKNIENFLKLTKVYNKPVTIITGQNSPTMIDLYKSFGAEVVLIPFFSFLIYDSHTFESPYIKENTLEKRYVTLNRTYKKIRELLFTYLKNNDLLKLGEYSFLFLNEKSFVETNKIANNSESIPSIFDKYHFNKNCFLNIVVESVNEDYFFYNDKKIITNFVSEKTQKTLATGLPFLIVGEPNFLNSIKDYGIKTFSNYWDETYDLEEKMENRAEKFFNTIKTICYEKESVIKEIYSETETIYNSNKEVLKSIMQDNIDLLKKILI